MRTDEITAQDPGAILRTPDEAVAWMRELVDQLREARRLCEPVAELHAKELRRRYHVFLTRHGGALGACLALFRAGLLSHEAYHRFRGEILDTLAASVVEVAGGWDGAAGQAGR